MKRPPCKITRLAPSPTGALHLGNARTLLLTWLCARSQGLRILLRVEDLDSPRKKAWALPQMRQDLNWLGLDWDGPEVLQSNLAARHATALLELQNKGLLYPCSCSRSDLINAQDAPHEDGSLIYEGSCRGRFSSWEQAFEEAGRPIALRVPAAGHPVTYWDRQMGSVTEKVPDDFIVARWCPQDGVAPGYQLACTVDDADAEVDLVIRGADLKSSATRQRFLQEALGFPDPNYAHAALVVGPDGRRLAKRHGDTRLASYREAGVSADHIQQWVAHSTGLPRDAFSRPSSIDWDDRCLGEAPIVVPHHALKDGPPL